MQRQNLLLTGASGFLGRNIAPELSKTYRITTCGRSHVNNIAVDLSLCQPSLPGHFDVVVHAAALAHDVSTRGDDDIAPYMAANVHATRNLCLALEKVGVPHTLIYISTISVYGDDSQHSITESHPLRGISPYSRSKIIAEHHLRDWAARVGCHLVVLRPALITGLNPPGNLRAMINGIRTGRYLRIDGGRACKSLVHAIDIARLVPLLEHRDGVYNLADGTEHRVAEIEECIARQLQRPAPRNIPLWLARILARVGDCLGRRAPFNSARLRKITSSVSVSSAAVCRDLGFTFTPALSAFNSENLR